jgi:hypothetical protein
VFVHIKQGAGSQVEGDRDQLRRRLQVHFSHLAPGMVAGVCGLRLCEVRQLARRERRRDWRHGEREKAKRKETGYAGATCGSNHETTSDNKNPASLEDVSFSWRISISGANPSIVWLPRRMTLQTFLLNTCLMYDNREVVTEAGKSKSPQSMRVLSGRPCDICVCSALSRAVFVGSTRMT